MCREVGNERDRVDLPITVTIANEPTSISITLANEPITILIIFADRAVPILSRDLTRDRCGREREGRCQSHLAGAVEMCSKTSVCG